MSLSRYYINEKFFEDTNEEEFVYYQLQKQVFDLFLDKVLTETAFKIYVLFFDRAKLSYKNNYMDSEGKIYIKYTYAELKDKLKVSNITISNALKLLENQALIEKKRQYDSSTIFYLGYLKEN